MIRKKQNKKRESQKIAATGGKQTEKDPLFFDFRLYFSPSRARNNNFDRKKREIQS